MPGNSAPLSEMASTSPAPDSTSTSSAPVAASTPPVVAGRPSRGGVFARSRFFAIAALVAALLIVVLGLLLLSHHRVSSTDGAFSVEVPGGWTQLKGPYPDGSDPGVMTLYGPVADGVQPHVTISSPPAGLVALDKVSHVWTAYSPCRSGTTASVGSMTPTTVGGSPALTATCDGTRPNVRLAIVYVNHGGKTYVIALTAAGADLEHERAGPLNAIIASWHWN